MRWTPVALALAAAIPTRADRDPPLPGTDRPATPPAEALRVQIARPRGGWTSERLVLVAGTVSDRRVRRARVVLNGEGYTVNVVRGRFEVRLPAAPGENVVELAAQGEGGADRDLASFTSTAPAADVAVLLTWDTGGTDLDLHVTGPDGVEVHHGARRSPSGAVLEVDDTDGYGPEVYLAPRARPGEYRVAVSYYDAAGVPQTESVVTAILHGGTPDERRLRFPVVMTREGETVDLASFQFDRAR